ncbi:MAG: hypothetical protein RLZZ135_1771 [Cyanobacteriota bacterium]|jgi:NAD(P)-dependent dehydrogenase (short-subunit alcohol dehydrogenase family)
MMNSDNRLNVVLGASGGLGSAVVWQLVQQGKRVRAVSRTAERFDLGHRGSGVSSFGKKENPESNWQARCASYLYFH